jgi:hypothetical protein
MQLFLNLMFCSQLTALILAYRICYLKNFDYLSQHLVSSMQPSGLIQDALDRFKQMLSRERFSSIYLA